MEAILIFLYVYAFVVGCCIASFMNVVIYRVPLGISVAKGRSFCPSCHHQLHAVDLIPILSYLFLRGRCRYCKSQIPVRDTLLEFLGGIVAIVCFYRFGFDFMTLLSFVFLMILQAIAMIDLDTMEIPDGLVICILIVGFISLFVMDIDLISRIIGFFVLSVPLMILNFIVPDAFGGGDIKLLAACGFLLGWQRVLLGMFIAVVIAGVYAAYLLLSHRVEKDSHIAFGPYICFGMAVALFYGQEILYFYLGLFGL